MNNLKKTACISDIHGNLTALNACLEDIRKRGCDEIICLGDLVAKGFHNRECVKLIRENCSVVIQGNCDEFFSRDLSLLESEREKKLVHAYQNTMDEEDLPYLASLPFSHERMISGRLVRFVHAAPDSLTNYSANTLYASVDEKYSMFLPSDKTESQKTADVLIYGHVHEQMHMHLFNRMLVCTGSVGNALDFIRNEKKDGRIANTINAQYTIIEGTEGNEDGPFSVQSVQIPYDVRFELETSRDFFEYDDLEYELLNGNYRNHERIRKVLLKDGIDIDLL